MDEKIFGKSGDHVIVEEFLQGPEVSVLSFTDGETLRAHGHFHGPQAGL